MCGIVSVFGAISVNHEKAFKNMLVFDQVRGEHSTGVALVSKASNSPAVVKTVGTPDNLFDMNSFTKAIAPSQRAMIGHNRYATVGAVNKANAHPFTCGAITGVHNGSLRVYKDLDGYGEFPVDSNSLYNHISKHGLADALNNCYGAMALVWWDEQEGSLNIYRNDERPLHWAITKDGQVGFLASERWMIWAACSRNNIEIGDINEVPLEMLITTVLPVNAYNQKLPTPTGTPIKSRKEPVVTYFPKQNTTYTVPRSNRVQQPADIPTNVVGTCLEAGLDLYGTEYTHFYEEVDSGVSRTFVITKAVADQMDLRMGDTYRFDCRGHIRKGAEVYYTIAVATMEKLGEGFEYTTRIRLADDTDNPFVADDDENDVGPFLDVKAKDIGKKEWYKRYGTCAYCTGDVDHSRGFKFNTQGGAYCDECITNPVIADALPR